MSDATYENIQYWLEGAVARVRLNRPEKANSLSPGLLADLDAVLARTADDPDVRVLLIDGAGNGFCGGYDLNPAGSVYATKTNAVADWQRLKGLAQRWLRLNKHPKPTIVKIHGYCLAGGLELMSNCDLAIAAEDTRIGYPAVRGVGMPGTMMFPFLMQMRTVKRLLFTGDSVTGAQAVNLGLVNEAVPRDSLDDAGSALAQRVALMPLDQLLLMKAQIVRSYEILGLDPVVQNAVEFDVISHFGPVTQQFWKTVHEEGLRAALQRRDGPFDAETPGR